MKYTIILTKGNDRKVISTHDTKEEALEAGKNYNATLAKNAGVVSCVLADVDENNNIIGGKIQIFETWL